MNRVLEFELDKAISSLGGLIYNQNKDSLYDINKVCEDLLVDIFNIMCHTNQFKNANEIKVNFPAVDIINEERSVCIQVTSQDDFSKIRETIEKYDENKLYNKYKKLYIFLLKQGKPNYRTEYIDYSCGKFIIDNNVFDLHMFGKLIKEKVKDEVTFNKILSLFADYNLTFDNEKHSSVRVNRGKVRNDYSFKGFADYCGAEEEEVSGPLKDVGDILEKLEKNQRRAILSCIEHRDIALSKNNGQIIMSQSVYEPIKIEPYIASLQSAKILDCEAEYNDRLWCELRFRMDWDTILYDICEYCEFDYYKLNDIIVDLDFKHLN